MSSIASAANELLGEYQDRRNLNNIDCSKTLWILATNALDDTIKAFCQHHHDPLFINPDEAKVTGLVEELRNRLRHDFIQKFKVRPYKFKWPSPKSRLKCC